MAVEIDTAYRESAVVLEDDDARRFMDDVKNPSTDERRLEHLARSAETFEELKPDRTANELLRND